MEGGGKLSDLLSDKQDTGIDLDEDFGSPVKLPEVPRTFTYGDDVVESYWDEKLICDEKVKENRFQLFYVTLHK